MNKVYITLVKISVPHGGDFYVALKSDKIASVSDLENLGINESSNKEEVLDKVHKIDSEAKIVGGVILAKNENMEIGGVYKPNENNEVLVDEFMSVLDSKLEEVKKSIKDEFKKKGR